jgi:hypothetical protein
MTQPIDREAMCRRILRRSPSRHRSILRPVIEAVVDELAHVVDQANASLVSKTNALCALSGRLD